MAEQQMSAAGQGEAQQPAPQQQPAQPTEAVSQSASPSNNKMVPMIVGAIILVVVGVAGYGYWNGSQIKSYAQKAQTYMDSAERWDTLSSEDFAKNADTVKSDSEKALSDLNAKKAPSKAANLETKLKEYFNYSKEIGDALKATAVYTEVSEELSDIFTNIGSEESSSGGLLSMATAIDSAKISIDKAVKKLEANVVPSKMKGFNDDIIAIYKKMSVVYGDFAAALRSEDIVKITQVSEDMTEIFSDISTDADPTVELEKAYGKPDDKLASLEKGIKTEIDNLKNTSFSF